MASTFLKTLFLVAILGCATCGGESPEFDNLKVPASEFVGSVRSTVDIIRQVISIVSQFSGAFGDFRLSNAVSDCLDLMDLSVDQLSWTVSASQNPKGKGNGTGNVNADMKTWLSGALINQDTCKEGFDGTNGIVKDLVAGSLDQVTSLVYNILSNIKPTPNSPPSGGAKGGGLGGGSGGRKLISKNQFPDWLKPHDRNLLQSINGVTADVVVAADGTGNFTSIKDAIGAAPEYSSKRYIIYIKKGVYKEYVEISKKKWNIMMIGEGTNVTVISGNRNFIDGWTTYRSATFAVKGQGFIARDITFENTAGPAKHQAVAFRSDSDLSVLYRCAFRGYQDTLYAHSQRQFYRECIVSLIPSQNREKFDEKGEKLVFIGYSDETKGYRLFNPITNKLVLSRDVIFDESAAWNFESEGEDVVQNPIELVAPVENQSNQEATVPSSSNTDEDDSVFELENNSKKFRSLEDIYSQCNCAFFSVAPQNFVEASKEEVWRKAMDEEMRSIEKNATWKLMDLPHDKEAIGLKWVFKTKFNEDGSVQKHKARLVAKGYSQQPGVDFTETFAPVVRMETVRTVLAIAAQMELQVFQLDVKSAFLNGELEDEVYVKQPPGYEVKGKEGKVYKLQKALYGLKQAPRAWNSNINSYFVKNGFVNSPAEPSLYVRKTKSDFLMVCLYVDDLIYAGTNDVLVDLFKKEMMKEYEMSDLGLMKYFLGIQVKQKKGEIFISQEKYVSDLLKRFQMETCKAVETPISLNEKLKQEDGAEKSDPSLYRSLVGALIYLTNTRPDILFSVSLISRFMCNPSKLHFSAAKRVLRYLQGTKNLGIKYEKEDNNKLVGFSDSDWAGSQDDRKSTSAYIFCIGSKPVSWSSKKQISVALSSTEAEYISANEAAREAIWLRRILKVLQQSVSDPTSIYCDNQSAISMTKNPVFHGRSKHIELRHHYIRDIVRKNKILLEYVKTTEQPADVLTKAVSIEKLHQFKDAMKITN